MARPTLYTEELQAKANKYLDVYESLNHAFPSDLGLADYLDISTSTLYNWAGDAEKPEFLDILDKINTKQQLVAWDKGLKGVYNANLTKLLLGKHGYSDKIDTDVKADVKTQTELKDSDREILNRALDNIQKRAYTNDTTN